MSDSSTRATVCAKYGLADRELVDFGDSPGGFTFYTSDGVGYIDVPVDMPDADGKTGLMFIVAPIVAGGYRGDFPIFTNPTDDEPETEPTETEPTEPITPAVVAVPPAGGKGKP